MRAERQVEENLGNGTVQYAGIQATDPLQLTIWQIAMYGGLVLSDDRKRPDGESIACTAWWVITGPAGTRGQLRAAEVAKTVYTVR